VAVDSDQTMIALSGKRSGRGLRTSHKTHGLGGEVDGVDGVLGRPRSNRGHGTSIKSTVTSTGGNGIRFQIPVVTVAVHRHLPPSPIGVYSPTSGTEGRRPAGCVAQGSERGVLKVVRVVSVGEQPGVDCLATGEAKQEA